MAIEKFRNLEIFTKSGVYPDFFLQCVNVGMASDYKIVSAYSAQGTDLAIPISWEIDHPQTDLTVFVLSDNKLSKSDNWAFDSSNCEITVKGNGLSFSAFVFRSERATVLASLASSSEVSLSDLIKQFQRDSRILEQLQVLEKTALRAVDELLPIQNASGRAGKVLAFDSEGNPDLGLSKEDVIENI